MIRSEFKTPICTAVEFWNSSLELTVASASWGIVLQNDDASVKRATCNVVTTWRLTFVTKVLQCLAPYCLSTAVLNGSILPAPNARVVSRIGAMVIGRGESNFWDRNSPAFWTQVETSRRDLLHICAVLKTNTANCYLTLQPAYQTTRHYFLAVSHLLSGMTWMLQNWSFGLLVSSQLVIMTLAKSYRFKYYFRRSSVCRTADLDLTVRWNLSVSRVIYYPVLRQVWA